MFFLFFHSDDYDDMSREDVTVRGLAAMARGRFWKRLTREIDALRDGAVAVLRSIRLIVGTVGVSHVKLIV